MDMNFWVKDPTRLGYSRSTPITAGAAAQNGWIRSKERTFRQSASVSLATVWGSARRAAGNVFVTAPIVYLLINWEKYERNAWYHLEISPGAVHLFANSFANALKTQQKTHTKHRQKRRNTSKSGCFFSACLVCFHSFLLLLANHSSTFFWQSSDNLQPVYHRKIFSQISEKYQYPWISPLFFLSFTHFFQTLYNHTNISIQSNFFETNCRKTITFTSI